MEQVIPCPFLTLLLHVTVTHKVLVLSCHRQTKQVGQLVGREVDRSCLTKFNSSKKKEVIYEWYFIVCTCKLLRVKTISSVSKNLKCNDLNSKRAKRLSCSIQLLFHVSSADST